MSLYIAAKSIISSVKNSSKIMKLLLRIKKFDWASAAFMVFFVGGIWVLNTHAEIIPSINNLPERLKLEDEFAQTNQPPSEQQPEEDASEQSTDSINQLFDLPQDTDSVSGEEGEGEESSEATFTLQQVNFTGNSFFTSEELQVAVQDFLQQDLGFTGLRELASAVSQFYQNQGWWARATIPPQDIVDGIVLVEVIEAKLGEVQIVDEGKSQSLSAKLIDQFVHFNLAPEEILNVQTLSENITRLNELPGIIASASLQAGQDKGQTDILLDLVHQPEWTWATQYDNYGSRSSGYMRLSNYIDLLGYLGMGETLSVQQIHTIGSDYWRLAATLPMSPEGHQAIFSYNQLEYELGKPNTNNATGSSQQWQAQWKQQLKPIANTDLSMTLGIAKATYVNDINTGNSSDKDITKLEVGMNFSRPDNWQGGGVTYGSWTLTAGDLNLLRNTSDYNTDQAQAQTHGPFQKINLSINRLQNLAPQWQLNLKAQGQFALKNLDGAERFSLGGAYGVRAYPNSEGSGDDGALAQFELEHKLNLQTQLKLFYDVGVVSQYKSYWANWDRSNPGVDKVYLLQGAGVSMNYIIDEDSSFNVTYAVPIGTNPGEDSSGNDNDGTNQDQRLWFTYQKRF